MPLDQLDFKFFILFLIDFSCVSQTVIYYPLILFFINFVLTSYACDLLLLMIYNSFELPCNRLQTRVLTISYICVFVLRFCRTYVPRIFFDVSVSKFIYSQLRYLWLFIYCFAMNPNYKLSLIYYFFVYILNKIYSLITVSVFVYPKLYYCS